jgi:rod shape-determining protein MreC
LLITDPSSKISVLGRDSRTPGILTGEGADRPLSVNYVHQNAHIRPGEVLITSGLDRVFPKGLPAAMVTDVRRSDISLFQEVTAAPLVELKTLEEVLLLMGGEPQPAENRTNSALTENATTGAAARNRTAGTTPESTGD